MDSLFAISRQRQGNTTSYRGSSLNPVYGEVWVRKASENPVQKLTRYFDENLKRNNGYFA